MRRHAKASTAGPTQRQANGLGRFLRGARAISLDPNGSSAPRARRLVAPLTILAAVVLLVAALPAGATKVHIFEETFGSAAQPSFESARGIAIDQSSGDVLVMDAGTTPSIKRYNANGTPDPFSALGGNAIDGKGNGECPTVAADCDQTPENGLAFASAFESQIAVDNSGGTTDGNIYVTQSTPDVINVFSEDGEYLGRLSESSGGPFVNACGVAVDSSGALYIGSGSGGIHKFVPAANPPVNADNTATFNTVSNACSLAAGVGPTAGFLFSAVVSGPISKLDSSTGELKYVVSASSYSVVVVDPASGRVLGAVSDQIHEFDASGVGSAAAVSTTVAGGDVRGLAVRGASGEVYVSRLGPANPFPNLEVFGTLVAIPTVATGAAASVEPNSATLNGTVNPDGVAVEECRFEYGTSSSYGQSVPCAQSPAAIGSGTAAVPVSADISGLHPGTAYHYRLAARNEHGTVNGSDQTLQTPGPHLVDVWTESVVRTEATLRAKINPEGSPTTYRIEWGPDASYGSSTPEIGVGNDSAAHLVSRTLSGLQPGSTYHWRVVLTSGVAVSEGPDLTFTTYPASEAMASCPNDVFRVGPAAKLPDCRAYEMVSPVDKGGADIKTEWTGTHGRTALNQAAIDGEKVTYSSWKSFGDQTSSRYSNQYIATRGPGGWTTHGINAPQFGPTIFDPFFSPDIEINIPFEAFTDDLSTAWLWDQGLEPIAPGAQKGAINLFSRDNLNGKFEALMIEEPTDASEAPFYRLGIEGFSKDGSHAVFALTAKLTPNGATTGKEQLYEFTEGDVRLVSVLPSGEASPKESNAGSGKGGGYGTRYTAWRDNVVSDDGSRIFWTTDSTTNSGTLGRIYVRIDGTTTVPVSPGGGATWVTAATDGSKALYTQQDPDNPFVVGALIKFDVNTETRTTVAAEVSGVVGASDDLSHVYFVSREALASGAVAGDYNFYLDREGAKTFIAALSGDDIPGFESFSGTSLVDSSAKYHGASVTPDGEGIAFQSRRSLTEYDNTAQNGEPAQEVYVYDSATQTLTCASCNPSGARPQTKELQEPHAEPKYPFEKFSREPPANRIWAAAWITTPPNPFTEPRILSEDGNKLFFNAFDALVPGDTNGQQDVYQWEAQGSGTCTKPGGCVSLISTGQSAEKSEFVDASSDGRDAFFETTSNINPDDSGLVDIYDARAGGGYPPPTQAPPCVGDACQPVPSPPNDPTPASASFKGAGNATPAANCSVGARKASELNRQVKRLRARAVNAKPSKEKALLQRASSLAKKAKGLDQRASRCRRTNRGAGR